jgi:RimJ/RimL family protein N-acetyltransferase
MGEVELVTFDKRFFEKSRSWLVDEEVNRMTDTGELPSEPNRLKWFESLPLKKDYFIWGVACEEEPIGACGLKNIQGSKAEYWGYIGEKSYWGKGLGSSMLKGVEQKAKDLNLDELYLTVLVENNRAIGLYRKNGYLEIGEADNRLIMAKRL